MRAGDGLVSAWTGRGGGVALNSNNFLFICRRVVTSLFLFQNPTTKWIPSRDSQYLRTDLTESVL